MTGVAGFSMSPVAGFLMSFDTLGPLLVPLLAGRSW
jgi:hypothetical protein